MWRSRLHPRVSFADVALFKTLCDILPSYIQLKLNEPFPLLITTPDCTIYNPTTGKHLLVYLDGFQAHRHREERDEQINGFLERKGVPYLRFPYNPPLTKRQLKEITETILREVEG